MDDPGPMREVTSLLGRAGRSKAGARFRRASRRQRGQQQEQSERAWKGRARMPTASDAHRIVVTPPDQRHPVTAFARSVSCALVDGHPLQRSPQSVKEYDGIRLFANTKQPLVFVARVT
jgi:hypothetical protein